MTISQENGIIRPQKSELKKVAHILSEAFMDYPMMQYFLPNEENRKKNFHVLWETSVNYAWKYGDVMVTEILQVFYYH